MKMIKALLLGVAAVMVIGSTMGLAEARRYKSFLSRMYSLRAKYRGHVHIAKMNMGSSQLKRPAIFVNTDFGTGNFNNWNAAQKQKFASFQADLSKAMGTNTLRIWNPHEPGTDQGGDWLQVASCKGYNPRLAANNRNQHWKCYSYVSEREATVPKPGTEQTNLLVKLNNTQLTKFNHQLFF